MAVCNNTEIAQGDIDVAKEIPLFGSITFHHLGLFISGSFGLAACVVAIILLIGHATHYSKPWEQKHIIRILAMIPIYAIISFVSYYDFWHAVYWQVLRDCYEAFAIASFFTLLCNYIEPTLHDQKAYFRKTEPRNWVLPISWLQKCTGGESKGPFRKPRNGLTTFNIIWVGVFQYCFIRVFFTLVAMITQFFGRYCESSISPAFSHVWVLCFEGVAVTIAMYCLIQFYLQIKEDIAEYKPFLKICCIKLVIFFSFWQSLLISFLTSSHGGSNGGILKASPHVAFADLIFGIPSMLLCIEMFFFSLLHIVAFPFAIYDVRLSANPAACYQGGALGWRALADAFNPWDFVKAFARGFRWLAVRRRQRNDPAFEGSTKLEPFSRPLDGASDAPPGSYARPGAYAPPPGPPPGPSSTVPYDDPARPFHRAGSDASDDHRQLLAHAADVPTIAVRAPSPFRDASPDVRGPDAEAGYDAYGGRRGRGTVDTPPSPEDDDDDDVHGRPPAALPGEDADLGYYGGQRVVR